MAKSGNGNSGNGNTGTTGQSAASAQAAAAAGNATASNAANGNTGTGNTSNTSGTSGDGKGNAGSTNTSTSNAATGATNSAGLMGSLIGFGNAVAKGEVGNNSSGSTSGNNTETSNEAANKAYYSILQPSTWLNFLSNNKGKNTGPSLNISPAVSVDPSAVSSVNKATNIPGYVITEQSEAKERGENFLNPSFEYAVTHYDNNAPADTSAPATTNNTPVTTPEANNAPGGNLGGETGGIVSGAAPTNTSDATNTGVTYRGGTVTTPSGTSVTDSGTGGSISSSVTPPIRDESSIGLGVYNNDRANYDQDNWNRGMEVESSSLVSDEECKAFAKRAFMENSEPFKIVRTTIIKKC